jgi:hypothetical protein
MALVRLCRLLKHTSCIAMLGALGACSGAGDEEHPAPAGYERDPAALEARPAAAAAAVEACPEGTAQECKVMLGRQGDVVSCFVGVQLCLDGEWGPCQSPAQL